MASEGNRGQERADRIDFYTALLAVQQEAPDIEPTRVHAKGYPYASTGDCRDLYFPILWKHGFTIELAGTEGVDDLELKTSRGGIQWMTTVMTVWRVTHRPTGFSQVYRVSGRRTNDQDKGVMHAIASAEKTLILRLVASSEDKNDEDPARGGAEPATGSRPPGGRSRRQRGSQPRRQQRAPQAPPPPPKQENGNAVPPAKDASDEERIGFVQAELRLFMRRNHFRRYQLEAVIQRDRQLQTRPRDMEAWGPADYEYLLEHIVRRNPRRFDEAPKELAEEFPTSEERVELLDKLVAAVGPPGPEQMLIANAKASGWNDAVEYWIDDLLRRNGGEEPE